MIHTLLGRLWHEVQVYGWAMSRFRRNARLFLLCILLYGPGLIIFGLLYNLYLLEIGFDEVVVGQVIAAQSLGTMLSAFPSAMFYNRWGGRISFAFGIVLMALTRLLMLMVMDAWLISVASFFAGVSTALINTAFLPFLADESEESERAYLFSLNSLSSLVTEMTASLLGGWLPGFMQSLLSLSSFALAQKLTMILALDVMLIGLVPVAMMGPERRALGEGVPLAKGTALPTPRARVARLPWRAFCGGAVLAFFFGLMMGTNSFQNVYFSEFHGATAAQVGFFVALSRLASGVMISSVPSLARRWGMVRANVALALIAVPFYAALGLRLPLILALPIFLVAYSFFRGSWIMIINLMMSVVPPWHRGTQSSIRTVFVFLAMTLAGSLGGWLIVRVGYAAIFIMAAGAAMVTALAVWTFFRHDTIVLRRQEPAL